MKKSINQKIQELLEDYQQENSPQVSTVLIQQPRIDQILDNLYVSLVAEGEYVKSAMAKWKEEDEKDKKSAEESSIDRGFDMGRTMSRLRIRDTENDIEKFIAMFEAGGDVTLTAHDSLTLKSYLNIHEDKS